VVYFPYKTAIEDVNLPQWMKYYGCKIARGCKLHWMKFYRCKTATIDEVLWMENCHKGCKIAIVEKYCG
jgi:hypothetical protein